LFVVRIPFASGMSKMSTGFYKFFNIQNIIPSYY
jgi:hypothetical protein